MKIMIDIPEVFYEALRKTDVITSGQRSGKTLTSVIFNAVANGIPLPKDHGRLIDADEAIKTLESLGSRDYRRAKGTIQEAVKMLRYDDYTPTVIEAESERE